MTILEKIDKLRIERGWSVNYLAMEAMLTQSTLNNLYSRKAEPKISTLKAICSAFGITLAEFFADDTADDAPLNLDGEIIKQLSKLNDLQKEAVLKLLRSFNG